MSARMQLMGAALCLGLFSVGCSGSGTGNTEDDAGEAPGCFENASGGCVLDSEACPAENIVARDDGQTCASCAGENGDVEICGASVEARCVEQENAFGDACQRCVTDAGEILYDDCFGPNAQVEELLCESAGVAAPSDPDSPEGPGAPVIDESTECEVCRDANGQVVSTRCAPAAESCAEIEVAGRMCLECTTDGVVIYRQCDPLDIDPRFCVSYSDDDGVCIDCYGQNDELLTHECVVGGTGVSYCEDERTPEGYVCSRCYSTAGLLLEEQCYFSPPSALRCQELLYTDQSCLACVGEAGELLSLDCWSVGCEENADCPPPAPCEWIYTEDGNTCRVCATEQDGARVEELQCIDQGGLVCIEEVNVVEGSDSDPNGPDGALIAQHCVVCFDDDIEVYRQCQDVGTAPPPACEYFSNFAGEQCETCVDHQTGDVVYSSCQGEPVCYDEVDAVGDICTTCYDSLSGAIVESSCGTQVCSGTAGLIITDVDGQSIKHPGTDVHVELTADCSVCEGNANTDSVTSCTVTNACIDPATGEPGLVPEPNGPCGTLVSASLDVVQCGKPWGDGLSDVEEALRIIAWGAVDLGVLFHSATLSWSSMGDACDGCDCLSGQRLDVVIDEANAAVLVESPYGFTLN